MNHLFHFYNLNGLYFINFSGEWVKNKNESWSGNKLKNCSEIRFDQNSPVLKLTLLKDGKGDGPHVESVTITGKYNNTDKSYKCGDYKLKDNKVEATSTCVDEALSPKTETLSHILGVKKLRVSIGEDGTDDDVSVKVKLITGT